MEGQKVIVCKNCGSNAIQVTTSGANGCAFAGFGFILICVGIWIPFIGWFIVMPIGALMMISSFLFPLLQKRFSVNCQNCKHKFYIDKEEYEQYKESIK
ncbi:hypothetical protein [Enterococcus wangshanyuanii]|uniref:LITAF domain-containing protein n=1 Tax=Enterococcus wangshanyuanii TaxID=2005703 RepID=A0ABQ1P0V5_9ENTE|nr:hypothetical protein [Enterococcus wangshanyuanii]GGC84622.1 hypothetical protein GCM10011573_12800 [Enterococcus wangshanyuanii]